MTRRHNAGAGGGCYLFSFEVGMRQGRVTLPCESLRGVRAPNTTNMSTVEIISIRTHWPVLAISIQATQSIDKLFIYTKVLNWTTYSHNKKYPVV